MLKIEMKATRTLGLVGLLTMTSCSQVKVGAEGWVCEQYMLTGGITATQGNKFVSLFENNGRTQIEYTTSTLTREEALRGLDICIGAIEKYHKSSSKPL